MSELSHTIQLGSIPQRDPELALILDKMYRDLSSAVNRKPSVHTSTSAPSNSAAINATFDTGDLWVKTDTDKVYSMTSRTTQTAVTWSILN